jgi:uncharacterized protein (DUF2225 family)
MTTLILSEVQCPRCQLEFATATVASFSVLGSHTDFCPVYGGEPPLFHAIIVCPRCRYADQASVCATGAGQSSFIQAEKEPKSRTRSWTETEEPRLSVLERYRLAIETAQERGQDDGALASIYLRASWCARLLKKPGDEQALQNKAIEHLQQALAAGLAARDQIAPDTYLVGELYRRLGRFREAIEWFDRVKNPGPGLADLTARMRELTLRQDPSDQLA